MSKLARLFEIDEEIESKSLEMMKEFKGPELTGLEARGIVESMDEACAEEWRKKCERMLREDFDLEGYRSFWLELIEKRRVAFVESQLMGVFSEQGTIKKERTHDFDNVLSPKTKAWLEKVDQGARAIDRMTKDEKRTFVAQLNAKLSNMLKQGKLKGLTQQRE